MINEALAGELEAVVINLIGAHKAHCDNIEKFLEPEDQANFDHWEAEAFRILAALSSPETGDALADELEAALNAPTWAGALGHVHNALALLAADNAEQPEPSADTESLNYMREIAQGMGYPSVLEALEHLSEFREQPVGVEQAIKALDLAEQISGRHGEAGDAPTGLTPHGWEYIFSAFDAARAALAASSPGETELLRDCAERLAKIELLATGHNGASDREIVNECRRLATEIQPRLDATLNGRPG